MSGRTLNVPDGRNYVRAISEAEIDFIRMTAQKLLPCCDLHRGAIVRLAVDLGFTAADVADRIERIAAGEAGEIPTDAGGLLRVLRAWRPKRR